jgi:hypothetical protein
LCWPIAVRGGVFLRSGSVLNERCCSSRFLLVPFFRFLFRFISFRLVLFGLGCIFFTSLPLTLWSPKVVLDSCHSLGREMAFLEFGLVHPLS